MIIQILGPVGGGKTHLMRAFMDRQPVTAHKDERGRDIGYSGKLKRRTFFVIGDYRRVCGGAEGLPGAVIRERIQWAMKRYDNVLFEGMMASTCFGTYAAHFREWAPGNHSFAFIHPPINVCAERVAARRAARGDVRPYKNTNNYFHSCMGRAIERAKAMPAPYVVLDWKEPLSGLLCLVTAARKTTGINKAA